MILHLPSHLWCCLFCVDGQSLGLSPDDTFTQQLLKAALTVSAAQGVEAVMAEISPTHLPDVAAEAVADMRASGVKVRSLADCAGTRFSPTTTLPLLLSFSCSAETERVPWLGDARRCDASGNPNPSSGQ